MDYAIFLTDPTGIVTAWNAGAERMFGYAEREALGLHLSRFFTPTDVEQGELERHLQVALRGQPVNERWLVRKDGTRFWASGFTTALRDEADALLGYALLTQDTTEQREAGPRLDELLAMLGHELRNPLAPIHNVLEMFRLQDFKAPTLRWACGVLDRQVQNLTRMVDDLVQASRITRGKIELRKERIDLAVVIDRAVEGVRPLIDARGHQLVLLLPAEAVPLEADVMRLAQVFNNLLDNAARYMPRPGNIRLIAERQGEWVEVRVRDEGAGIPTDMLEVIFRLFMQVGHTLARSEGGLGVGLAIARSLVELHGGTVAARSDGLDKGSEFSVRLPVLQEVG